VHTVWAQILLAYRNPISVNNTENTALGGHGAAVWLTWLGAINEVVKN